MTEPKHSANIVEIVYGSETLRYDDPSENFFESSKIYRPSMSWDAPGVGKLMASPDLQQMTVKAGKRFSNRAFRALPEVPLPEMSLSDAIRGRRSYDHFGERGVSFEHVAAVLYGGYGSIHRKDGPRRTVPSAGALYPLDLYLVARNVIGLKSGIYHFDTARNGLTDLGEVNDEAFLRTTMREDDLDNMAFSVVICASFWRARFKYGPRAYRFVLMDAGHAMQNMLLTCTGLGLGSRPYGGFIDDEVTSLMIGQNGVDEAPVYVLAAGTTPE